MEPTQFTTTLLANHRLGPHTSVLRLGGCEALKGTLPGQFVMLRGRTWGDEPLLPRAFSLLRNLEDGVSEILIKGTGKAAMRLVSSIAGEEFQLLGPLGSTFPEPSAEREDWLLAGGVGLAPLLMYAIRSKELGLQGQCTMFYGGRSIDDIVLQDLIHECGCELKIATEDGSLGVEGYVTKAVEEALSHNITNIGESKIQEIEQKYANFK